MEKRGVSIFVFTIMFTLIAGAILLVFFFNFGKDLISFSKSETKVENLLILEKNLASFALSSNSEKTISFSDRSKINIYCENKKVFLSSNDGKYKKEVKKLIFSPFDIDSTEVEAWTLAWNYPFKIDNLYFVADDSVIFYFPDAASSGQEAQYFHNKFKQTKFKYSPSQPTSRLDKGVVVYFKPITSPFSGENIKVVSFDGLDSNEPKVKFKDGSSWSNYYPIYGDSMLYAALFSADKDKFSCILGGLAKERVSNIAEVYKDTIEKLKRAEGCQDSYQISGELDKLSNIGLSPDPRAYDPAKRIKELNENLKTTNCPVLYKSSETSRLL